MNTSRAKAFTFESAAWLDCQNEILAVRHKVFMIEQHFEKNVLHDTQDKSCSHLVVRNPDGMVIACGRITNKGRIGRIAVLLPYRGAGIGSKLLEYLEQIGRKNDIRQLSLNAEVDNRQFYSHKNFSAAGPVYMKQGVPHQMLAKKLA
jgi:predicted GNAT family N-acyltransferase